MPFRELKEDRIEASKLNTYVYTMASSSKDAAKFKHKFPYKGKKGNHVPKKRKYARFEKSESPWLGARNPFKKKNMVNVKCYNCGNKGHFAHDCNEPKKV